MLLVESRLWLLLSVGVGFALGLGVSSLIGSRATSIAGLLAFVLAIAPLLLQASFLGTARGALVTAGIGRLEPAGLNVDPPLHMSLGAAIACAAAWTVVPLALGAWRTVTRDA
jgi:hypothetical protein